MRSEHLCGNSPEAAGDTRQRFSVIDTVLSHTDHLHFISQQCFENVTIIHMLQMKKLRLREGNCLPRPPS